MKISLAGTPGFLRQFRGLGLSPPRNRLPGHVTQTTQQLGYDVHEVYENVTGCELAVARIKASRNSGLCGGIVQSRKCFYVLRLTRHRA